MTRNLLPFKPTTGGREPKTRSRKQAKVFPIRKEPELAKAPQPPALVGDAVAEIVKMLYRADEPTVRNVMDAAAHGCLGKGAAE
jgi:hypothetical protein